MEVERHREILFRKKPSFSSSLLDAIYRSIDEPQEKPQLRRCCFEQEIQSLCRDIRVEKWIQSTFQPPPPPPSHNHKPPTTAAVKFDSGQLKKLKEPISPGGRIVSFLNAIFAPRNSKKATETAVVTKSRSLREEATTTTIASRRYLTKNASFSWRDKNTKRRSVNIFCVNVGFHRFGEDYDINDGKSSCSSSDLFEIDSLRRGMATAELPVYGTTAVVDGR